MAIMWQERSLKVTRLKSSRRQQRQTCWQYVQDYCYCTLSKSSISFPTLHWCFYLKLNSNQNQYKSQKFPLFLNCLVTHSNNKDVTPALTLNETNKLDFNDTMEFDTNEKRTLANLMQVPLTLLWMNARYQKARNGSQSFKWHTKCTI